MSDTTNDITVPEQDVELIDLDDVEGHGLREVAAGLGAAAVLAGGASAAMASTGITTHLPTVHASAAGVSVTADADAATAGTRTLAGNAATQTRDAALGSADHTTQRASAMGTGVVADVQGLKADVVDLAADEVADAKALAKGTVTGVEKAAGRATATTVSYAEQDVAATKTIAGNASHWAADTATTKADNSVATAGRTESSAVRTVTTTKDAASATVDRKTATVLSATSKTVAGVTTITAGLKALDSGAGVDVQKASGWMTLKAGDVVVAQWQVHGDTSTATVTVPGGTELQLTYTGDDLLAPSARTIIS